MLSVVIPTLNAAAELPRCLAALEEGRQNGLIAEIIVADGGSDDDSVRHAESVGARALSGPPGRGRQLRLGAQQATGDWLLFLHADTALAQGWSTEAGRFIAEAANARRAGVFSFALDDDKAAARRLQRLVALRCRIFGLAYGDQGLLISRAYYDRLGGFRELPLMEDVDLVRRIGRRRLSILSTAAVTSAARYRCSGYLRRSARNLVCLALYAMGVPARTVAKLYG